MCQAQKEYYKPVSIHGGHSGEFCYHASDYLEDMILAYIDQGFKCVGITEHVPPLNNWCRYPDEIKACLSSDGIYDNFCKYFIKLNWLKKKYSDLIKILTGFETETITGYEKHIAKLINKFNPDYIVGSVHHVDNINFDFSYKNYSQAILNQGGIDNLYIKYFDIQYEMINTLKPQVVGHFDLIRIFDSDYKSRLKKPEIKKRITRNLKSIKSSGLILDFNMRALLKGASEPYISEAILKQAFKLKIPVIPGDDSHSLSTVGLNITKGIKILEKYGFDINFKELDMLG